MRLDEDEVRQRVRLLLKTAGVSVPDLAEKLGMTPQGVYLWFREGGKPNLWKLPAVAAVLYGTGRFESLPEELHAFMVQQRDDFVTAEIPRQTHRYDP